MTWFDIGQGLHFSGMSIRRAGPGEQLVYYHFPELGIVMLSNGKNQRQQHG